MARIALEGWEPWYGKGVPPTGFVVIRLRGGAPRPAGPANEYRWMHYPHAPKYDIIAYKEIKRHG